MSSSAFELITSSLGGANALLEIVCQEMPSLRGGTATLLAVRARDRDGEAAKMERSMMNQFKAAVRKQTRPTGPLLNEVIEGANAE